jgi:hypothetical protein
VAQVVEAYPRRPGTLQQRPEGEVGQAVSSLIDVHHHVVPPAVRAKLAESRIADVGGVPIPRWDESRELERVRHGGDA